MDVLSQVVFEQVLVTFDRSALRLAEALIAPDRFTAAVYTAYLEFVLKLLFLGKMPARDRPKLAAFDQDFVIVCIRCKLLDRPKEAFYLLGVHFVLMGRLLYAGTWPIILAPILLTPAQSEKRHSVWLAPPCPCLPRPPPARA